MDVIDVHVHLNAPTETGDVERLLDEGELAGIFLFSESAEGRGEKVREKIEEVSRVHNRLGGRVYPFARIDPTYEKASEVLEWAVRDMGIAGCKMLPSNFHPNDPCARKVYETIGRLKIPLLMHTGILWIKGNNANNCRPANMEVMWDYPDVRFAMAHIGWPWTDECIAVAQKIHHRGVVDQAFIDMTPGTPPSYRLDVLSKCLELIKAGHLMYGSDAHFPINGQKIKPQWRRDKELLEKLGVDEKDMRRIFYLNALRFLGVSSDG